MYQGKQETVTLRAELSLVNILYDQFGQDILIHNITDKTFDVTLTISIAPTFISWLFQFDKRIEVLSPASLIEEIKKTAHNVLSIYDK